MLSAPLFIKGQLVTSVIQHCTTGNDKSDSFPQLPGYFSTNDSRGVDSLLANEQTKRHMDDLCPGQVRSVSNKPSLRAV